VKVEKLSKELTFVRRDLDDAERKIFRFEKESWQDRSLRDYACACASCNLDTLQVKVREEEADKRARSLAEQLQLKSQEAEQLERKLRQEAKDALTDSAKECAYCASCWNLAQRNDVGEWMLPTGQKAVCLESENQKLRRALARKDKELQIANTDFTFSAAIAPTGCGKENKVNASTNTDRFGSSNSKSYSQVNRAPHRCPP
jgi:hypothetical protein